MDFIDGILRKHNQQAYVKLIDAISQDGKACAVHATGTGKMYLALKWLVDNKYESFVYVAPTNVILNKFLDVILEELFHQYSEEYKYLGIEAKTKKVLKLLDNHNIKLVTYAGINSMSEKEMKELSPKRIVLDEFHRCGADKWGESVEKFLTVNNSAQILGLSATPIRPSDGKNMVDELFDGKITSQITLEEAFTRAILPVPKVIHALYSFEEDLQKATKMLISKNFSVEKKSKIQRKIEEAKKIIEQGEGLEEVFSYGMGLLPSNKSGKFLVFCQNIDDMETKINECRNWFGITKEIEIYSVDYTKGNNANMEAIALFEENDNDKIKLLFSVDMLNEGLHVDDIDGVIMLRPTTSNIVFLQQLGRALSTTSGKVPIVFDLVNNVETLDNDKEQFINIVNKRYGMSNDFNGKEFDLRFSIQGKLIDIFSYLNNVMYTYEDRFAPLIAYYKEHGTIADISKNDKCFYDGREVNLESIIFTLRRQYKLRFMTLNELKNRSNRLRPLSDKEVELLEKMGMVWEVDKTFQTRIEPLIDYYNKNGTISDLDTYKVYMYNGKEVKLGKLLSSLRTQYKLRGASKEKLEKAKMLPLTDDQVETLEKMGMIWFVDRTFEGRIVPLIAYYKEHGTIANINKRETYLLDGKEYKIGQLVSRFRTQYKLRFSKEIILSKNRPLTDKEVKILEDIGMVWEVDKTFETRIESLISYHKEYGTISSIKKGQKYSYGGNTKDLSVLIYHLRNDYKEGKLSNEEIGTLESMGMVWSVDKSFETRVEPLVDYYNKYGNITNIPARYKYSYNGKEYNLGVLVNNLKRQYQLRCFSKEELKNKGNGTLPLTDKQVEFLEKMGMVWTTETKKGNNGRK